MHLVHRSLCAVTAALTLASACSTAVEGDADPSYGDVVLTVLQRDPDGAEVSREERSGPGDQLVAPLDRALFDPIEIDGDETTDPSGLLAARQAQIDGVALTREGETLRAAGDTLLGVRSARREGNVLAIEVEGARFDIGIAGALSTDSADRFLATALVRLVRGEALLADDCRPDCLYSIPASPWICGPAHDSLREALGGAECTGPITSWQWDEIVLQAQIHGRSEACDDLWYIPRPLCLWTYDNVALAALDSLRPDPNGLVCASDFYDSCMGESIPSCGTLRREHYLTSWGIVSSCDARFELRMEDYGNLVLLQLFSDGSSSTIWQTGTYGDNSAIMQSDGNLVVYGSDGVPLWASGTQGHPGARLAVQDDGNLVIYQADGTPIWASSTCCH